MIKELIKIASALDARGLVKEADKLDAIIRKMAEFSGMVTEDYNIDRAATKLEIEKAKTIGREIAERLIRQYPNEIPKEAISYDLNHGLFGYLNEMLDWWEYNSLYRELQAALEYSFRETMLESGRADYAAPQNPFDDFDDFDTPDDEALDVSDRLWRK